MSIHLFWGKYDRFTTSQSFFEVSYREFTPELSSRDYEHIIATKLCEDLLDVFLNSLKLTMVRSFELLETSYTSELYLCSQKRLIKFMENVLQFIKIERIYLSYLEYPLKSGILAGENTLMNSLLRLRCLLKDFKIIFNFNSKKDIEDFANAKDLARDFANYFKIGFTELKNYGDSLKQHGLQPYDDELVIVNDMLTICDAFKMHKSQLNLSQTETDSELSNTEDFEGLSRILGSNNSSSADCNTLLKNSLQSSRGKPSGLSYMRLEPEYLMKGNFDPSVISRDSDKRSGDSGINKINEDDFRIFHHVKYDFHKYDKEFKESRQFNTKRKLIKDQVKEEVSVFSILRKGNFNLTAQDLKIFSSLQDPQKKPMTSCFESHKPMQFPLTHHLDKFQDADQSELLSLINVEYDPRVGMKLSTNVVQQAKIKQRAEELEELATSDSNRRPQLVEETQSENINDSFNDESESDEDLEDMDFRERRDFLEKRRKDVNVKTDVEFQPLATGLHGEPTIINNYAFYENTLLKYEKPKREYLKETETVFERPTHAVDEFTEDHCFREMSPRATRKKFLEDVFGSEEEQKMYDKYTSAATKTIVTEITNNKDLHVGELEKLQRNIEAAKGVALEKTKFARESVEFFFNFNLERFKQCVGDGNQKKRRMEYLWQVLRDCLSTRIFYKKVCRKSAKEELKVLSKIKATNLTQNLFRGQESLIFQKNYTDSLGVEREFVVLNRLMRCRLKLDYMLNFDSILKPILKQ